MKSVIKESLLRRALLKGTVTASFGLFIIIMTALFPLSPFLSLPSFLLGLFFITMGLLPYKRLSKMQLKPDELKKEGQDLIFIKSGKPLFKIAQECIERIEYVEKRDLYGLGIILKRPVEKKIVILQPKCDLEAFTQEGFDLFLPYFKDRPE